MKISICKWYNDFQSPVLLFVDDLANVWIDSNENGLIDLEEDWGYAKDKENSSFKFLCDEILMDFPKIKTTFFVPVGVREGVIKNSEIKIISKMINSDEETKAFFRKVNDNDKFEIAYHGTSHGISGEKSKEFIQEWETFKSLDEAIKVTNGGKRVYKEVFGYYPKGGKYCGYKSNTWSDESIDKTDFLWWCRYWNYATHDIFSANAYDRYIYGGDNNEITNYDIKTFGENEIVDIPSTLDGGMFTDLFDINKKSAKGIAKIILRNYLLKRKLNKLDFLIKNKLVISIQEHISPSRNDSKRQYPNIFDDRKSLKYIFDYLKNKNVWYCTATELAEYYFLGKHTQIIALDNDSFKIIYTGDRKIINKNISLKMEKSNIYIIGPDGHNFFGNNGIFNINIIDGIYRIKGV